MWRATSVSLALCVAAVTGMLAADGRCQATGETSLSEQPALNAELPPLCQLVTIAKGDHSNWGHEDPDFGGAEFIINDPEAWDAFWCRHFPEPVPPPPVDFDRHVVVVVIQGLQPTAGGPSTSVVELRGEGPLIELVVIDDERPGPIEELSNPFHIVVVEREGLPPRSMSFQHLRPHPETGVVAGRVLAAPPQDQAEPWPLPEAHVMLAGGENEPLHAMTGMDGSYFFVNVPPGEYVLVAEHPDFEPAELPLFVPPDGQVRHDFVLAPLPVEPGVIAGQVLGVRPDGDPEPLPESLVQLIRDGMEVERRWTNEDGFFVFELVPPGPYLLRAEHEGFWPQEFPVEVGPGGVVEHVFVLEPPPPEPGAFLGRVLGLLDDGHQVPIPQALVRLLGPEGEVARTHTNRRGAFHLWGVPPGEYLAVAEAEGWLPAEAEVEIRPAEPTFHVFQLLRR